MKIPIKIASLSLLLLLSNPNLSLGIIDRESSRRNLSLDLFATGTNFPRYERYNFDIDRDGIDESYIKWDRQGQQGDGKFLYLSPYSSKAGLEYITIHKETFEDIEHLAIRFTRLEAELYVNTETKTPSMIFEKYTHLEDDLVLGYNFRENTLFLVEGNLENPQDVFKLMSKDFIIFRGQYLSGLATIISQPILQNSNKNLLSTPKVENPITN